MIELDGISLSAGQFRIQDVALAVGAGEYFVLMGRTGSGKSLLIKTICGLRRPSAGRVAIDGRDVTALEPRRRHVGYMPQDCGLLPHLTVRGNIEFPLRAHGARRADRRRAVDALADMLHLGDLLRRRCDYLSGGERQKVALARALAAGPKLLLLDEPVSALDEPARREVCAELREVQRRLGLATIHVCHSLEEARSVADRVGVLDAGRLQQTGTIADLTAAPAGEAVARLMNVSPA